MLFVIFLWNYFGMPESTGIFINSLSLSYYDKPLFDGFSLSFSAGRWTGLLGKSGVGKSTLLRLLAGLPAGVDQSFAQHAIHTSDDLPLVGRVAYMSQHDSLMPWLSVLNNVLIGYRLRGQKVDVAAKERALQLLAQSGLQGAEHFIPHQLSGGMKQRVALVRTLFEARPIILMDEPFAAVDVITRLKLQDLSAQLLKGKTVVMVTHDPLEALRLCDQIYVLRGQPAVAGDAIFPEGTKPRLLDDPNLLKMQGHLLSLLAGGV